MLEAILNFIEQAPPALVMLAIFAASYLENMFPPLPGDTILIFCAYLVGRGKLPFETAMITTLAGSVVGFMTMYAIGRFVGRGFIFDRQETWFSPKSLERIDRLFNRWGYGVIAINRFLAGLRSVVALFAGVGRLNALVVFTLAFVSSVLWNGGLLWLGSTIGENWETVGGYLKQYNSIISLVIVGLVTTLVVHRIIVVRRNIKEKA